MIRLPPRSPLFPYTTLFRSITACASNPSSLRSHDVCEPNPGTTPRAATSKIPPSVSPFLRVSSMSSIILCCASSRSEEHTSELQSRQYLVCRLLLEKKNHNPTASSTVRSLPDGSSSHARTASPGSALASRSTTPHLCLFALDPHAAESSPHRLHSIP